jgi:hypothetical protein
VCRFRVLSFNHGTGEGVGSPKAGKYITIKMMNATIWVGKAYYSQFINLKIMISTH